MKRSVSREMGLLGQQPTAGMTTTSRDRRLCLLLTLLAVASIAVILTLIAGTVAYLHYTPSRIGPVSESMSCEDVFCAYGALCLVDQKTQQAYCRCPDVCADVFAPVCGTDEVTYTNECRLRRAACAQQRRISVRHAGPCDAKDPCEDAECPFGAVCRPSLDGRTAECVCPDKCSGNELTHEWRPVCGTDGRDYPNVCELKSAACREMKDIEVKFYGKCDPCDGVECPSLQVCQLDEDRNPICRCNSLCSPDFRPVCGSDGKTYNNECFLRLEACRSRKALRVFHYGECNAETNPCSNLQCHPGEECHLDMDGSATCRCPEVCPHVMRPVCGSDGKTYDNDCELKKAACLTRQSIDIAYRFVCGDDALCKELQCPLGAVCVVKAGHPSCACPSCAEDFQPVCGSDGISYTNECRLRREACEQRRIIRVAHEGVCGGCESKKCDFYALCETNGHGEAMCVCPRSCVQVESPVCGSDGVTYQNDCELRVAACQKQQLLTAASRGPCDLCKNVQCQFGAQCQNGRCVCPSECPGNYEPVCANNSVTYRNPCEMRRASCLLEQELSVVFRRECEDFTNSDTEPGSGGDAPCDENTCLFGGICEHDMEGNSRCQCTMECPPGGRPQCGSDGKIYGNDCQMEAESCRLQKQIVSAPMEICNTAVVSSGPSLSGPCFGEAPLTDPKTGYDMECDNSDAKSCPPGSYCHRTSTFAKCCRDVSEARSCEDSPYGCCYDGRTKAKGPNFSGCQNTCQCNRLGSYTETCDPQTKQCSCKPGVGGILCDRCLPSFWGLHKIAEGNSGCTPCSCNEYGSVRDDCEQMTGRCVCKQGVQGMKCDLCPVGFVLGPDGCTRAPKSRQKAPSCAKQRCYYGATCKENENEVRCVCDFRCPREGNEVPVCGSDGNTYGSECQLRLFSCRYQTTISIQNYGPCQRAVIIN